MDGANARWLETERIVVSAWEQDPAAREAYVVAQCGDDLALLDEVRSLLDAQTRAELWQEPPATDGEPPARTVGPYRLEKMIGRGGMGAVYLGRRADGQFEQTVAVKLIGLPLELEPFRARFRRERQILAALHHPNITRLLDGGVTEDGELYLVMEFVDGVRVDEYARAHGLTPAARLKLFREICGAVEHAHQNLIIHRDIKPSNILVDKQGVPKLLDFGTAKLMEDRDDTGTGLGMMTVAYASPEQLRGQAVTTQSDVFSLGVLLYELLCGRHPFGTDLAARLADTAITFSDGLDADLRGILAKALAREPAQRYRSVEALSEDLRRYEAGEPVQARPDTVAYRAAKFLRRNRGAVIAAMLVGVSILAGTLATAWQARLARERYRDLRAVTGSLLFDLNKAIADIPGSTESQKLLVTRVVPILDRLAAQGGADAALQRDLAEAYRQLGDLLGNPYSQNLGDVEGALKTLEKARALAEPAAVRADAGPDALRLAGKIEQTIAETQFATGKAAEALPHAERGLGFYERMMALSRAADDWLDATSLAGVKGDIYGQPGTASLQDLGKAEASYLWALGRVEQVLAREPGVPRALRARVFYQMKLGDLRLYDDPRQAATRYADAVRILESTPSLAAQKRLRGWLLRKSGEAAYQSEKTGEAIALYRRSLAVAGELSAADRNDLRARHDEATAGYGLAVVELQALEYAAALPRTERLLALLESIVRAEPRNTIVATFWADTRCLQAEALYGLGRREAAAAAGGQCLRELEKLAAAGEPNPQAIALAARRYATLPVTALQDPRKAEAYARRHLEQFGAKEPAMLRILAEAQARAGQIELSKSTARLGLDQLKAPSLLRTELQRLAGR